MDGTLPEPFAAWFAARGWQPRAHQLATLHAARTGESVLLVAPTGGGKTLAGFLPSLIALAREPRAGLHTLYVSPLKALAIDIARNLTRPIEDMGLPIAVETRTGDTPANRRARQRESPPHILLTTPESLAVLLSLPDLPALFANLATVVMDEVHALAGASVATSSPCASPAWRHSHPGCAASACRRPSRIPTQSRPMSVQPG